MRHITHTSHIACLSSLPINMSIKAIPSMILNLFLFHFTANRDKHTTCYCVNGNIIAHLLLSRYYNVVTVIFRVFIIVYSVCVKKAKTTNQNINKCIKTENKYRIV